MESFSNSAPDVSNGSYREFLLIFSKSLFFLASASCYSSSFILLFHLLIFTSKFTTFYLSTCASFSNFNVSLNKNYFCDCNEAVCSTSLLYDLYKLESMITSEFIQFFKGLKFNFYCSDLIRSISFVSLFISEQALSIITCIFAVSMLFS